MQFTRLLIADDQPVTQEGICAVLEEAAAVQPIGRATNGQEILALAQKHQPGILLLSLHLPGPPLDELIKLLRQQSPLTKVVIFDNIVDSGQIREIAELGIVGYVLKEEDPETLLHALHTVASGGTWFSQPIAAKLLPKSNSDIGAHGLTIKERTVLKLVVDEKKDKEIAQTLNLSERTVRKYLRAIYDKLGVDSRAGASYEAGRLRLFDD